MLYTSPDLIGVVESFLNEDVSDNEISIQGYSIVRLDRNRHSGGVLILGFCTVNYALGLPDFEFIVVSITCSPSASTSPDFYHCSFFFYRAPNSSVQLLDNLFSIMCSLDVSVLSHLILIGDFNHQQVIHFVLIY